MIYIVYIAADVLIGGIVFGMVSSNRVRKEFTSRIEESGYRANILERNAAALGGSINELRSQHQKAADDFEKLRSNLEAENGEMVRAETQLAEMV